MSDLTFEIFRDRADEFRWRLKASNGKIIAVAGEGYVDKRDCLAGIHSVQSAGQAAAHVDRTLDESPET